MERLVSRNSGIMMSYNSYSTSTVKTSFTEMLLELYSPFKCHNNQLLTWWDYWKEENYIYLFFYNTLLFAG